MVLKQSMIWVVIGTYIIELTYYFTTSSSSNYYSYPYYCLSSYIEQVAWMDAQAYLPVLQHEFEQCLPRVQDIAQRTQHRQEDDDNARGNERSNTCITSERRSYAKI